MDELNKDQAKDINGGFLANIGMGVVGAAAWMGRTQCRGGLLA